MLSPEQDSYTNIPFLKSTQTVKFLVLELVTYRLIQIVRRANVKLFALKQEGTINVIKGTNTPQCTIALVFKFHGIHFFSLFADCRVTCQVFPSHLSWLEAGQKVDANYGRLA